MERIGTSLTWRDLRGRLRAFYNRIDDRTGGAFSILSRAFHQFNDARGSEAAASMAYYAFFSLFPLLLILVAAGSFFVESTEARLQLVRSVTDVFPVSQQLIWRNIQQVLEQRGTVGVAGILGLLWSASGVFGTLSRNINRAWPEAEARGFVEGRLVGIGIAASLIGLLILSLVSATLVELLPLFRVPLFGSDGIYDTRGWVVVSTALPWLFALLLFLGLYRWVPNAEIEWKAAVWGALVAGVAWRIVTSAFRWYLGSGLARYELVYGSLGTIVALMFWIYVSSWVILFGAHFSAAVAARYDKSTPVDE